MKKFFSILLLLTYLGMLYLPYVPYLYYSFAVGKPENQAQKTLLKSKHFLSSDNLIGDVCYLKAIKKRGNSQVPKNKTKQPVNIIMVNNLEVLAPLAPNVSEKPINCLYEFGEFSYLIIEKIKDIDIPPPKSPSFC